MCFSAAVGGGFVCLCACYYGSVVFFFSVALRFDLPTRPVFAPSAAALNRKHQQPLTARRRPDKRVPTDKAEHHRSATEVHNTNANIQP